MGARTSKDARSLTDTVLRSLKPRAKRYDVPDKVCRGLKARVSPTGEITLAVVYRTRKGIVRTYTVGRWPKPISLAAAREKAQEVTSTARLGGDPQGALVEARAVAKSSDSFIDLAERYIEARVNALKMAPATETEYRRMVASYLAESDLAELPAKAVTADDLDRVLEGVAQSGPVMANRLYQFIRAVCRRAVKKGKLPFNPSDAVERPRPETSRERELKTAEVVNLWETLAPSNLATFGAEKAARVSVLVKLLLLLAQRSTETVEMRWTDLDLKADTKLRTGVWTIPGRFRKGGRLHVVPLSPIAVKLISSLPQTHERVFPGVSEANAERDWWGTVRDLTMAAGTVEHFTKHDLRRTCTSWCTRLGATRFIVSKILGHAEARGNATAVYDRYEYLPEKAAALNAWAAQVQKMTTRRKGATVLAMRRA